jgi:cytochrome c-type biogenesis protein CcmH/NrfF
MFARIRSVVLVIAVAVLFMGQGSNPLANPRVRRVGDNLLCLCGCYNTVTSCNMLHCHYADPAREKIAKLVAEGKSDEQIWEIFAKENGKQAVLTPPKDGFYLVNWVMPAIASGAGLVIVWAVIRRLRRRSEASPTLPEESLDRYQDQIEKEVAKLD